MGALDGPIEALLRNRLAKTAQEWAGPSSSCLPYFTFKDEFSSSFVCVSSLRVASCVPEEATPDGAEELLDRLAEAQVQTYRAGEIEC